MPEVIFSYFSDKPPDQETPKRLADKQNPPIILVMYALTSFSLKDMTACGTAEHLRQPKENTQQALHDTGLRDRYASRDNSNDNSTKSVVKHCV